MKKQIIIIALSLFYASCTSAGAKIEMHTNWQDATDAAMHRFELNVPRGVQSAATACGNYIRTHWDKQGSRSTVYSDKERYIGFKVEVFSNNGVSGCKVTPN